MTIYVISQHKGAVSKEILSVDYDLVHHDACCILQLILGNL